MEEQGFSIVDAFSKNQYLLIAMGFTCVVLGCERTQAENAIQQHILGGGNVGEIYKSFVEAVAESDFFQKMLGVAQEKDVEPKKTAKSKKGTEESGEMTE